MSLGSYQSRRISLSLPGLRNKQTNTQTDRQRDREMEEQTDGGTESEKPQRDFNYNCNSLGRIVDAVLRWQLFTLTRSQLRDTAHASSCAVQCDVDRRERSPDEERDTERALQTATGIVSRRRRRRRRTRSWVLSSGLVCILIYWNHVSESILIQIHFRSQRCDTRVRVRAPIASTQASR